MSTIPEMASFKQIVTKRIEIQHWTPTYRYIPGGSKVRKQKRYAIIMDNRLLMIYFTLFIDVKR